MKFLAFAGRAYYPQEPFDEHGDYYGDHATLEGAKTASLEALGSDPPSHSWAVVVSIQNDVPVERWLWWSEDVEPAWSPPSQVTPCPTMKEVR